MTCYMHHVPGRLRIRTPLVKNNRNVAAEVESLLLAVPGVDDVTINLTTGSCLVKYDLSMTKRDDIISLLSGKGYFDRSKAVTNDEYFEGIASKLLSFAVAFI
ncbi:MAG: HMA2 domain-containing protein [Syntrophorhabdales bacterium]